jgi:hypothetical protein
VILAGVLAAAAFAAPPPTYTVASLNATVGDAQVVHEGPGEDGSGAAALVVVSRSRPAVALSGRRTLTIRLAVTGEAHASFTLAERPGVPAGSAECSSPVALVGNGRATFTTALRAVRVSLALPYVRAPFVEASDLYPASGPCEVIRQTLSVTRAFNPALFTRPRVVLTLSGTRVTPDGDFTYTTRWRATMILIRR